MVVDQDGERVTRAFPATVPYQDPMSGSTTAPGVVAVVSRSGDVPFCSPVRPVRSARGAYLAEVLGWGCLPQGKGG